MRLGIAGLGPMGSRMAARLLDHGHEVAVWNRTAARTAPLAERGARVAANPAELARGAEMVLTMLADDDALRAVALGPDGVADGLADGAVHVSCGTISVGLARALEAAHEERGQAMLSAPMLGRPPAIEAGTLFVMAAGAPALVERFRPVAIDLGQRLFVLGDRPWMANLVKLCANFMIFSTIEQLGEVFALCGKAGVPEATVFDLLSNSFCDAPVHRNYGRLILDRAFSPAGGPMTLGAKDNALLLEAGEAFGVPLPIASLLRDRFLACLARGEGELDFAALSRRAREDAGMIEPDREPPAGEPVRP